MACPGERMNFRNASVFRSVPAKDLDSAAGCKYSLRLSQFSRISETSSAHLLNCSSWAIFTAASFPSSKALKLSADRFPGVSSPVSKISVPAFSFRIFNWFRNASSNSLDV